MSTILITGAYRGLGRATAALLVQRGHRVLLSARSFDKASSAAAAIGAAPVALDVTSPSSRTAAVATVERSVGSLDALVNNAAVLLDGATGPLDLADDVMSQTYAVNVMAPLHVARAFLPLLRKSPHARIVNVSSGAGQMGSDITAWAPAYSSSKAALNMITRHLAAALPGIAVNAVCPGWCRTEMGGAEAPRSAEEGADTIAWLAAEAPHHLTGRFFRDRTEIPW